MRRDTRGGEGQALHVYHLRISQVKMKVKFQCKMKIDYNNQPITLEVPHTGSNLYTFNQDITLAEDSTTQNCFTLSINLVTSKGAKYIAALAYLHHSQLIRAADTGVGSKLSIPLSKCLDPEATMEVVVKEAVSTGVRQNKSRNASLSRNRKRMNTEIQLNVREKSYGQDTPYQKAQISPRGKSISGLALGTRSEVNLGPSAYNLRTERYKERSRSRNALGRNSDEKLPHVMLSSRASLGQLFHNHSKNLIHDQNTEEDIGYAARDRDNSYSKIRQRLKKEQLHAMKEHEKRMNLQNSQNNAKLETLKYKLRCEQFEKNIQEKNSSIHSLESRIDELEKLLRSNSQHNKIPTFQMLESPRTNSGESEALISLLQTKVANANQELEQLRLKISKLNRSHSQRELLNKELESRKITIKNLENEINSLSAASLTWKNNSQQCYQLNISIQTKNKYISELEKQIKQSANKVSDLEKGKRVLQQSNSELVSKLEHITRTQATIDNQKTRLIENMETFKSKNNMAEFTIGSLKKTIQKIQAELAAASKFREKYNECQVELKRVEGEKKLEIRTIQNSLKMVNGNLMALQHKYNEDVDILNRKNQEIDSKLMAANIRNKELENTIIPNLKSQLDQSKRMADRAQRQCEQYKSSDRNSKRQVQSLESKLNQATGQMEMYKNKFRSLQNIHKVEADKYVSESKRIRQSLEQEVMKNLGLNQKYQGMATQHGIMTNKLSHIEDRYQKQTKDLSQKLEREVKKNRQLEQSLKKREQAHLQYMQKEKKLVSKIQEYGQNEGQYSELIRRYQRQVSKWQNEFKSCEDKLNTKLEQLRKIDQAHKQLVKKYEECYHQLQDSNFDNKSLSSELTKLQKDYDQIQYYLAQSKAALENKEKAIEKMKGSIEVESKNKTNVKEELVKMEMNYQNLNKDYERFREHLYGTLMREFTGIDGLEGLSPQNIHQLKESGSQRTLLGYTIKDDNRSSPRIRKNNYSSQDQHCLPTSASTAVLSNTDIISTINQFSKQSKMMISKLVDECRYMEKQLQKIRQNSEKTIQRQTEEINNKNDLIHKLEEEIHQNYNEKVLTEGQLMKRIVNLEKQIEKLVQEIEKKQTQNEEVAFALSGINMQKQSQKEYYEATIHEHQNVIVRLQKNLEHLHVKYTQIETKANSLSAELQETNSLLQQTKQKLFLQQKANRDKQNENEMVNKFLEENKAKNKSLLAQIAELEMLLTNQKQRNSKNVELIEEEEKKLTHTKDFMNNIIKQKQAIVKQEIQNTEKIIELEGANAHLKFTIEDMSEKLDQANKKISEQKDCNKKLNLKLKNNEQDQILLQQNITKVQIKLKEKEQELNMVNEKLRNMMDQYSKDKQKKIKQIQNFKEEIDVNTRLNSQEIDNYKKQIAKLEEQVLIQVKEELKMTKNTLEIANRELQNCKKQVQQQNFQIHSFKDQLQTSQKHKQKLEIDIQKLLDQLRSKDQQMYEISGELYSLEQRYHEKVVTNQRELQKFEEQFGYKYEAMVEDYETKLDELQKQRDYFKNKLTVSEEELSKLNSRLATMEYEDNQVRLMSQDKLIRSQQEKNSVVLGLKNQLKRALQAKQKNEEDIKKIKIQLQNIKSQAKTDKHIIEKYEKKDKSSEEKIESLQIQMEKEAQKQKKLEMICKQLQENVHNYQWGLEREVKKELQNLTKSIMVSLGGETQSKRRIMDSVKDIETRIIRVVGEQIKASTLK